MTTVEQDVAGAAQANGLHSGRAVDIAALVQPTRVHGSVYTSPDVFELEMERIFHSGWVFVAHESEVPEVGDYVTRKIGREPVIVARGRDGQVRVLANRCTHRGNRLCNAERGNARSFRCPYHGWTFANDGQLLAVPMKNGYADRFDTLREDLGLRPVARTDSYGGFVFASLAATGVTLVEHLGRATTAIDRLLDLAPNRRLRLSAGWMKHEQLANWKMVMENNVDGYHALFTHQSVYDTIKPAKVSHQPSKVSVVVRDMGNGHAEIDYSQEYEKLDEEFVWFGRVPRAKVAGYVERLEAAYGVQKAHHSLVVGPPHTLIFPNLFLAEMNIMTVDPIAVDLTVAYTTPALIDGEPDLNRRMLRRTEGAMGPAGFLIADDGEIGMRNQRGLVASSVEWLELSRGVESDVADASGIVNADKSAETPQRGFWQAWARALGARS
jgi:phenylpropionate dioxygenase-like ring-hydroxylating dioxygenase large terminal subunit